MDPYTPPFLHPSHPSPASSFTYSFPDSLHSLPSLPSLPDKPKKTKTPRKSRAKPKSLAIPPQTPPPPRHDLTPPASSPLRESYLSHSDAHHPSVAGKTVPSHPFLTPQSIRRQRQRQQSSSPVAHDAASNALGIFVSGPDSSEAVDPHLIYSGGQSQLTHLTPSSSSSDDKSHPAEYDSYTKFFRSPIQYPPYLGKRSLSDFGSLSSSWLKSSTKSSSEKTKDHKRHKRSRTISSLSVSSDAAVAPPADDLRTPPASATTLCFSISDDGQAVIECRSDAALSQTAPPLSAISQDCPPTTTLSRSRNPSSSLSIATISSSDYTSFSSDDDEQSGVSEAETEIFDPKLEHISRSDARVAMAKAIRRQQALLQVYRERVASRDTARSEKKKSRKMKRSASTNDVHEMQQMRGEQGSVMQESAPLSYPMMAATSMPARAATFEQHEYSQQQQQQQEGWMMQEMAYQHQHQQAETQAAQARETTPKRKRGRPRKTTTAPAPQLAAVEEPAPTAPALAASSEGVARCICHAKDWYGEPMIQCDSCQCWLHMSCVGLDPNVQFSGSWYCPYCTEAQRHHHQAQMQQNQQIQRAHQGY
ncbi:hypothetical protein BZA70DRAFT_294675 [Myxozyma melibiosi]|uniref:PHD-type domain-containing protein n=1 Tax=Myxozyma melibiosi TaxID=54550 RepID=A0ABR1F994_9ASCO